MNHHYTEGTWLISRSLCTHSFRRRGMGFRSQKQYEALQAARQRHDSEGGKEEYKRRAGIEGAIQHLPFPVEGNALQYK